MRMSPFSFEGAAEDGPEQGVQFGGGPGLQALERVHHRACSTPHKKAFRAQSVKNLSERIALATARTAPNLNQREDDGSPQQPAKPKRASPKLDLV